MRLITVIYKMSHICLLTSINKKILFSNFSTNLFVCMQHVLIAVLGYYILFVYDI